MANRIFASAGEANPSTFMVIRDGIILASASGKTLRVLCRMPLYLRSPYTVIDEKTFRLWLTPTDVALLDGQPLRVRSGFSVVNVEGGLKVVRAAKA